MTDASSRFGRMLGLPEGSPTHEEFARRVVECVNAMTGIGDPVAFMQELTAFLTDMSERPDRRVLRRKGNATLVQDRRTQGVYCRQMPKTKTTLNEWPVMECPACGKTFTTDDNDALE